MLVGIYGPMPFVASSLLVNTFSAFKRASTFRYAKHDVIGLKPVLESIGPELDKVTFMMRLDTTLGVMPLVALNVLRTFQSAKEAHPVVIGLQYFGNFILTDIDETWRHFGPSGSPRVIEVGVSLTESGQDWLNDTIASISDGFDSGFKSGVNSIGNVIGGL